MTPVTWMHPPQPLLILNSPSNSPTVCLCGNVISLRPVVCLLDFQIDLQCILVKSPSLPNACALASTSDSGQVVPLVEIEIDLQCVSVKSQSLLDTWSTWWPIRLTFSVSRWNPHLSRIPSSHGDHWNWPTVCLAESAIFLKHLDPLVAIWIDLQCVPGKSPSL